MAANWIALRGQIGYDNGILTYTPQQGHSEEGETGSTFAEARSSISFDGGSVRFEARIDDPGTRVQLCLNSGRNPEAYAGLNVGSSAYGIALFRDGKWQPATTVGFGNHPPVGRWIQVEVHLIGSEISLTVDGVRLATRSENLSRSQLGMFFQGSGRAEVRAIAVDTDAPMVFVVMQFTDEYDALYTDVIKPTCEQFGYRVVRGDDPATTGLIINDITKAILESAVVLADITPDNPNVYYEVGYAHALAKPTILLSDRKRSKLPFDVSAFRTLFYDNTIGGKSAVESRLRQHLQALAG